MKGLITAAGLGTRSGLDGKFRKEMLPVYDARDNRLVLRPIIDVIITGFYRNGIDDIAVVLDPSDRWTREYIGTNFPETTILFQEEKKGYGHAVLMARDFVGQDDFILNAGDGLVLNEEILEKMVSAVGKCIFLALMPVPNPENYGCPDLRMENGEAVITGVVEKSRNPPSKYGLCALYRLPPDIFGEIYSAGSNIELTPAIDRAIKKGIPAHGEIIERKEWISVGKAESYVDVLMATLEKAREKITS